jgi:predicted site-specific integrase-resolvase
VAVLTDIGPGLSARRKGLARLLGAVRGGRVGTVHVTQRDRLPRSGVGFIGRIFDD